MIYTSHSPVWDAKNRHGLPEELDLSYESIAPIFGGVPAPLTPLEALRNKLADAEFTEDDLRKVVAAKGKFPVETTVAEYPADFITDWIFKFWDNISQMIMDSPEHMPF